MRICKSCLSVNKKTQWNLNIVIIDLVNLFNIILSCIENISYIGHINIVTDQFIKSRLLLYF